MNLDEVHANMEACTRASFLANWSLTHGRQQDRDAIQACRAKDEADKKLAEAESILRDALTSLCKNNAN